MESKNENRTLEIDADFARMVLPALAQEVRLASDGPNTAWAKLLMAFGDVKQSHGTAGVDLVALVEYDGETYVVEERKGWARVVEERIFREGDFTTGKADYDLDAALRGDVVLRFHVSDEDGQPFTQHETREDAEKFCDEFGDGVTVAQVA